MWVPHDVRDRVVDFVNYWSEKTDIPMKCFLARIGIPAPKYYEWKTRYGKVNEHNSWIPRDSWLEAWEKEAILEFSRTHPGDGYRRLAFMMLDEAVVAVSPSSVYRVLSEAGLMRKWDRTPPKKGCGFVHPLKHNEHWHIDVSYINIRGTFYYLCAALVLNSLI